MAVSSSLHSSSSRSSSLSSRQSHSVPRFNLLLNHILRSTSPSCVCVVRVGASIDQIQASISTLSASLQLMGLFYRWIYFLQLGCVTHGFGLATPFTLHRIISVSQLVSGSISGPISGSVSSHLWSVGVVVMLASSVGALCVWLLFWNKQQPEPYQHNVEVWEIVLHEV